MIVHYSACFGTELVMLNQLVPYFTDYFDLPLVTAGLFAFIFGGTNVFARSMGGYASDYYSKEYGMTGRLWVLFGTLLGSAILLLCFGSITKDIGWPVALT
eukprot:UN11385